MSKWNKDTFKDKWRDQETTDYWLKEWKDHYGLYLAEFSRVINALKSINWKSLVEIGCGNGKNLQIIRANFRGKILVGFDINENFLEKARSKGINVANIDTEEIKWETMEDTDVVLSYEHLQHLHPDAYSNAVKNIKKGKVKYVVIYEGWRERPMVIKSGSGGRWGHQYEEDFGGKVVWKEQFEDGEYILLIIKLK